MKKLPDVKLGHIVIKHVLATITLKLKGYLEGPKLLENKFLDQTYFADRTVQHASGARSVVASWPILAAI